MHVKSHHVDLILDPWSRAEKGEEGGGAGWAVEQAKLLAIFCWERSLKV